ncbi:DUF3800 domain-containing protein [Cupriavidus sp. ISTL7]|nr:DUF3800 domain-containing protein [Cupriavidus sp. ISTL7]
MARILSRVRASAKPGAIHAYDARTKFFVLAGFCIFERQTHWLESHIDPIAERFSTTDPRGIEFHGAPMRAGKEEWQGIKPADRVQAVVDILSLLADRQLKLKVFASVIEEEHDGSRRDRATKLRKRRERI